VRFALIVAPPRRNGDKAGVGALTFFPPATPSQTFGAQTLTGFTFTKQ
jgi:hypothetical protein